MQVIHFSQVRLRFYSTNHFFLERFKMVVRSHGITEEQWIYYGTRRNSCPSGNTWCICFLCIKDMRIVNSVINRIVSVNMSIQFENSLITPNDPSEKRSFFGNQIQKILTNSLARSRSSSFKACNNLGRYVSILIPSSLVEDRFSRDSASQTLSWSTFRCFSQMREEYVLDFWSVLTDLH